MFDYKHVYVSLLKHKCLKVKHVSVSCFYSVAKRMLIGINSYHSRTAPALTIEYPSLQTDTRVSGVSRVGLKGGFQKSQI